MTAKVQAISPAQSGGEIMESVLVKGDLSKLTPDERSRYYMEVCKSVGLNPLTKPFEYITLNGKLTLYALRACTDQLRTIHNVSVLELAENEREGVFIVTAKVQNGQGRTDMAKGAVTISGLKGDALANAMMKAETKAKRRATLSLCGMGFLDETEIETIPGATRPRDVSPPQTAIAPVTATAPHDPATGELKPHTISVGMLAESDHSDWLGWGRSMIAAVKSAPTIVVLDEWCLANNAAMTTCGEQAPKAFKSVEGAVAAMRAKLGAEPQMMRPEDTADATKNG